MDECRAVPLEVGLKISVRESILNNLKNNTFVQQNFKLNVKRINRWWYSVYFDKICDHDVNTKMFGEDTFCLDCGVKLG